MFHGLGCYATAAFRQRGVFPCRLPMTDAFLREISIFGGLKRADRAFCLTFCFFFSRNVFKRCRFLGNKALSHMLTLLFLTVWHGLHSGYVICFSMEFLIVIVEKRVRRRDARIQVICSYSNGEPALCSPLIKAPYSRISV